MDYKTIIEKLKANKMALVLIGMALVLGAMMVVIISGDKTKEQEPLVAVTNTDVPPGEVEPLVSSKSELYSEKSSGTTGSVDDLWATLGSGSVPEKGIDLYAPDETAPTVTSHEQTVRKAQEDFFSGLLEDDNTGSENMNTSKADKIPSPGDPGYREYRMSKYEQTASELISAAAQAQKDLSTEDKQQESDDTPAVESLSEQSSKVLGERAPIKKTSAFSSLDDGLTQDTGGFSTLSGAEDTVSEDENHPFSCMFTRDEKLRNGSRVSVRLLDDIVVGKTLIPRNTHLMAMCAIGDRLNLSISSIEMGQQIYNLGYEAYDTDGSKGIYCPDLHESTKTQVKQRGTGAIQRLIGGRVGGLASDALQTGVQIVQDKSGEVTVSVPAGYRFFIVRKTD